MSGSNQPVLNAGTEIQGDTDMARIHDSAEFCSTWSNVHGCMCRAVTFRGNGLPKPEGDVAPAPSGAAACLSGWKFVAKPDRTEMSTPSDGRWTLWPSNDTGTIGVLYRLATALAETQRPQETQGPDIPESPGVRAALQEPVLAWSDVIAERRRQIEREGWTPEHDDEHAAGEMAHAAACYALHTEPVGNVGDYLRFWPWAAEWWKPKDRRRNLVRASALIIAEIERLDRAALSASQGTKQP